MCEVVDGTCTRGCKELRCNKQYTTVDSWAFMMRTVNPEAAPGMMHQHCSVSITLMPR